MGEEIVGRGAALAEAAAVLDRLDEGPWALVLEGEAGIGKSTLWRAIADAAADRGVRVLSARPAGSEARLAFGGLADLLEGVDEDALSGLPAPQYRAIEVALLRAEPDEHGVDPRAAGLGTLAILRHLAGSRPVLVAIDDAQWLDEASVEALAFALRRLGDARLGMLLTVRTTDEGGPPPLVASLPAERVHRIRVGPLSAGALYHLFVARLGHPFPRPALIRITDASRGNAFYALEIARALLQDGQDVPGSPMPVPERLRDLTRDRVRDLPASARAALLSVAALSRPTTELVDAASLAPAEAAGLVEIALDGRIAFTHPLFAAAVYRDAPPEDRRAAHRALATAVHELEERARHLALSATSRDPIVAISIAEAGRHARARGATAAAAELLELAIRLTPPDDVEDRLRRQIDLADSLHLAGQPARAQQVLEAALAHAPAGDLRGEALLALGMCCRETDQARAAEVCVEALANATSATIRARAHASLGLLYETTDVARAAQHSAAAAELFAELGDTASWALATLGHCWHELLLGHGADDATFWAAFEAMHGGPSAGQWWTGLPPVWVLAHDDYATAWGQFGGLLERARQEGNEGEIGLLRAVLAQIECWRGQPLAADEDAAAAVELARLGGSPASLADALRVQANIDAIRGRVERARETLGPGMADLGVAGAGRLTYGLGVILGLVAHSIEDEARADDLFTRTTAALDAAGIREMPLYLYEGDHVEAVLALGDVDRAEAIVERLEARAKVFPRPWTLAVGARGRGLVLAARGDLPGALASLEAAVTHHERLDSPYELGRTLLAKALVHRRRTEKRLARDALAGAVERFEAAGAELWAARARAELGRIRFRAAPTELTETELRIAELAAAGRTNREIAGTVFVSPKTVEARLASVYGKLGIRSRAELGAWMASRAQAVAAGSPDAGGPNT